MSDRTPTKEWNMHGLWVGNGKRSLLPAKLDVAHLCRVPVNKPFATKLLNYARDHCGTYVCNRCERAVPWCFGCADDMTALCDDCWAAISESV